MYLLLYHPLEPAYIMHSLVVQNSAVVLTDVRHGFSDHLITLQ